MEDRRKRKRFAITLTVAAIILCAIMTAASIVLCDKAPETAADVVPEAAVSAQESEAASVLPVWSFFVIVGCSVVVIVLLSESIIKGRKNT